MNKLAQDLPIGTKFEDAIVKYLEDKENLLANRILGCHPGYDIEVEEIKKTLECKYDRMSKKTGNIAIEYQCYGKPSGISSTKADFWVIAYFHNKKWRKGFIQVDTLREACKGLRSVKGGDDFASYMYLMPTIKFDEISNAFLAHPAERSLGKTKVTSSSLVKSSVPKVLISHGLVTHPLSESKKCEVCVKAEQEFMEDLKSGKIHASVAQSAEQLFCKH